MPTPLPLRLYLASVPGEMDGERAVIEGLVLPELRERAHGLGIEIVMVDPLKAKGEEWDLARRFREIEECQIFVGLLGVRYGEPPAAVPLALVAAHPWLAEDPGRSMVELEILEGAFREPGRRASFFYFRDPRPAILYRGRSPALSGRVTGERLLWEEELEAARKAAEAKAAEARATKEAAARQAAEE